jgi:hypothetical protein
MCFHSCFCEEEVKTFKAQGVLGKLREILRFGQENKKPSSILPSELHGEYLIKKYPELLLGNVRTGLQ